MRRARQYRCPCAAHAVQPRARQPHNRCQCCVPCANPTALVILTERWSNATNTSRCSIDIPMHTMHSAHRRHTVRPQEESWQGARGGRPHGQCRMAYTALGAAATYPAEKLALKRHAAHILPCNHRQSTQRGPGGSAQGHFQRRVVTCCVGSMGCHACGSVRGSCALDRAPFGRWRRLRRDAKAEIVARRRCG